MGEGRKKIKAAALSRPCSPEDHQVVGKRFEHHVTLARASGLAGQG